MAKELGSLNSAAFSKLTFLTGFDAYSENSALTQEGKIKTKQKNKVIFMFYRIEGYFWYSYHHSFGQVPNKRWSLVKLSFWSRQMCLLLVIKRFLYSIIQKHTQVSFFVSFFSRVLYPLTYITRHNLNVISNPSPINDEFSMYASIPFFWANDIPSFVDIGAAPSSFNLANVDGSFLRSLFNPTRTFFAFGTTERVSGIHLSHTFCKECRSTTEKQNCNKCKC